MKILILLTVVTCLCACATHGLRCSGELQPINAPAPLAPAANDAAAGTAAPDAHR